MDTLAQDGASGQLVFYTHYDPNLIAAIKDIPGRRWDADHRVWRLPASEAERAIKVAEEFGIEVNSSVRGAMQKVAETVALSAATDSAVAESVEVPGTTAELRPYQKTGVAYLRSHPQAILADEMGTGKTLQALSAVAVTGKWPALVICPASLRINWQRETERFFPGKRAAVIGLGTSAKRAAEIAAAATADVAIINYDILKKCAPALAAAGILDRARSLVADEAHYIKDLKSQRGRALLDLSSGIRDRDGLVILATGTPVINRPKDLIATLRLAGKLGQFGGWKGFVTRYCDGHETRFGWDIDGASDLPELERKLRATCYIRRTKDQVLQDLPEKQRSAVFVSLDGDDKREYALGEKELADWVRGDGAKEITDIAGNAGGNGAEILRRISILRQAVGHAKIEQAAEITGNILDGGQKAIVFAIHKEVQDALFQKLSEGHKAVRLTGEMGAEERQAAVDAFQGGKADVIVCSQKAGGVGLTLTAASNVVFAEYDWTAASHDQAEDRAHRIGQKNAVNVWYVHAKDTIDDAMATIIAEKREIARQVTGDKAITADKPLGDVKKLLASIEGRQGSLKTPRRKRAREAAKDAELAL